MFTVDLPQTIAARLQHPLPGNRAWRRFEAELGYGRHAGPAPENCRRAAVAIVLFPHDDVWRTVLIVRPDYDGTHASQVSFPGGELEYGESTADAALRELEEELGPGVAPELLGKLSPIYVFISNFLVTPWVAFLHERPTWRPCEHEVAKVIETPLESLFDPAVCSHKLIERDQLRFNAPSIEIPDASIWGATSMMISELQMTLDPAATA